jgi:hypothetical protein
VHQRSTNQIRPHCTATYLGQLSLHLHHKVAPALFGSRLLCFALSNPPSLPRGQTPFRPEHTTHLIAFTITNNYLLSEFAAQEDPEQQAAPAAAHEDGEQQAAPNPRKP